MVPKANTPPLEIRAQFVVEPNESPSEYQFLLSRALLPPDPLESLSHGNTDQYPADAYDRCDDLWAHMLLQATYRSLLVRLTTRADQRRPEVVRCIGGLAAIPIDRLRLATLATAGLGVIQSLPLSVSHCVHATWRTNITDEAAAVSAVACNPTFLRCANYTVLHGTVTLSSAVPTWALLDPLLVDTLLASESFLGVWA